METSALTKPMSIDSLQIRPITVISNTLNAMRSIYSLENSPLLELVLNPLSSQPPPSKVTVENVVYKGYVSNFIHLPHQLWVFRLHTLLSSSAIYFICMHMSSVCARLQLERNLSLTGQSLSLIGRNLQLVWAKLKPDSRQNWARLFKFSSV